MAVTDDRRSDATKDARRDGFMGWLDGVRSTRTGRLTLKIVVGVVGAALVIGGLLLVPLPGPGWLIVFAGLAVLATEFDWAHRLLQFAKRTVSAWTDWLKRQNWPVRILVTAATLALAAVIVWFMLKLSLGIDLVQQARLFLS
ncbi:TIGR02611 family protein [Sphaerisporangium perillae]|uniref:TIGR02611 family protein n=1 Tax=Sphaerisporangium perillae TaxID=2935860 RepID=UPI0020107E5F|nr:TIGR02611 family protein [Sphaerisporangium perillae]